jgi:arsenate reductase
LIFVFTLSHTASKEAFPDWPGQPVAAYWRYRDPKISAEGDWQRNREFARTLSSLEGQMRAFMQLPLTKLDTIALRKRLTDIEAEQQGARSHEASARL